MEIKVSVIVPCYNCEDTIVESTSSILNNTYKNLEVIIVDDGSTDASQEKISTLNDKRVKYVKKQNGGVSSARNLGISKATGDYICFLDADDFMLEDNIQLKVGLCLEHNSQLVGSNDLSITTTEEKNNAFKLIFQSLGHIDSLLSSKLKIMGSTFPFDMLFEEYFKTDCYVIPSSHLLLRVPEFPPFSMRSVFIHKELLQKTELFDEDLTTAEDIKFFFDLIRNYRGDIILSNTTTTIYNSFFSSWMYNKHYSHNDSLVYKYMLKNLQNTGLKKDELAMRYFKSSWLVAEKYRLYFLLKAFLLSKFNGKIIKSILSNILKIIWYSINRHPLDVSPKVIVKD